MQLRIAALKPCKRNALGATVGESHVAALRDAMESKKLPAGTHVLFDFDRIESTNGSYIKATVYWAFVCGQLYAQSRSLDAFRLHDVDPRPFDIYPAVANLSPDVREEIVDFFKARELPVLVATEWSDSELLAAELEGHLEPALRKTLDALLKNGAASAPELHSLHAEERITVTAWNNRLNDLWALRLACRSRSGRGLEYRPAAKRIKYGRSLH